jgi:aryl-alcohol dehydrogenase-like predicted oxidoreductase
MGEEHRGPRPADAPLVLGGHSFIAQLGSDPPASAQQQREIVASCLDQGIRWFDTTYQPERVALGNVLHALGRRDGARILAWNFFTDFAPEDSVGGPQYYRPGHIDVILEQLRTSFVDCLVVVPLDDAEENQRQVELATEWKRKGYARSLGLWIPDRATVDRYRDGGPFRLAIRPCNVTTDEAGPVFAACKACDWETLGTSPFVRGWELDKLVAAATARGDGDGETLRPVLADLMLRFSLFHRDVDRVIVAMRRPEWVGRNLASVARGPLTAKERRGLQRLRRLTAGKRGWWQRLWRGR